MDQRVAIADLAQSSDTGQAVPRREQPLAAEPGAAQLIERADNNLVFAGLSRRLAADNQVTGIDDVNAHEWVLHSGPATCRP
jgi:hypothetical protein